MSTRSEYSHFFHRGGDCGKTVWISVWIMWKTSGFQHDFGFGSFLHRTGKTCISRCITTLRRRNPMLAGSFLRRRNMGKKQEKHFNLSGKYGERLGRPGRPGDIFCENPTKSPGIKKVCREILISSMNFDREEIPCREKWKSAESIPPD